MKRKRKSTDQDAASYPTARGDRPRGLPRPFRRDAVAIAGRILIGSLAALGIWQIAILVFQPPRFILPAPLDVARALFIHGARLLQETGITLLEIVLGFAAGIFLGIATGLALSASRLMNRLIGPLLMISQAFPVFALAPLLVLWFGFGLASKVVMAMLIIYFPIASALADGLARTDQGLLDIARLSEARRWQTIWLIRFPSALPALVTGLKVAAVLAPFGAVVGEWVGASRGLGLLMVQANARMQTDLMFAALAILAFTTIAVRAAVDELAKRLVPWAEETIDT